MIWPLFLAAAAMRAATLPENWPAQRTGVQLRALEGGRRPTDKLASCNALLAGLTQLA